MSPVASWSPADYYRASRNARRAWERTDSQLTLGLDDAPPTARDRRMQEAARTGSIVEPVSAPPSLPAGTGSAQTEAADRLSLQEQARSAARRSF